MSEKLPSRPGSRGIAAFVAEARAISDAVGRTSKSARLMFAIDATQSREATWDLASGLQMQMFQAAEAHGGLAVQLVYFRGLDECRSSRWHVQARPLVEAMGKVRCRAGHTQIARVLRHALQQRTDGKIAALVLVGDAFEEEPDEIVGLAGQLAMVDVPIFAFQEGSDPKAGRLFREIARVTRGAFHHFDRSSPQAFADALRAVAVYAAGGRNALQQLSDREGGSIRAIAHQVAR